MSERSRAKATGVWRAKSPIRRRRIYALGIPIMTRYRCGTCGEIALRGPKSSHPQSFIKSHFYANPHCSYYYDSADEVGF